MANPFSSFLCNLLPFLSVCSSSTGSTTSSSAPVPSSSPVLPFSSSPFLPSSSSPLLPSSSSSPGITGLNPTTPTAPDDDPFYTPPSSYESAAPGTILNSRPVPHPLTLDNITPINYQGAWQLLYRTQNSLGNPEATVVTIIEPYNAKPNNLFSFSYFVDSAYNDCNPSIAMQGFTRLDSAFTQVQVAEIVLALDQGWYVSVADDEGPQAAFASGLQEGYSTLDSIRAALQSESITGLQSDAITTMTGYSGGSVSVEWALELQPTYAPELKIAGAAFGGVIPNLAVATAYTADTYLSGLSIPGLLGVSHDYPNLTQWISQYIKPSMSSQFYEANSLCILSSDLLYAFSNISDYFTEPLLTSPVPASVFSGTGIMGKRSTPTVPMYVYDSAADDVSPISELDALLAQYCAAGATITYERNDMPLVVHVVESIVGLPGAVQWLTDRQNGVPVQSGCVNTTVSTNTIDADLEGSFGTAIFELLGALLLLPIGPSSIG